MDSVSLFTQTNSTEIMQHITLLSRIIRDRYRLIPVIGSELEFYIVDLQNVSCSTLSNTQNNQSQQRIIRNNNVHHSITPKINNVITDITETLNTPVEHEKGTHQYEVIVQHTDCMRQIIDRIAHTKILINLSAKKYGLHAIFHPKPNPDDYGSGMHYHITLNDMLNGNNVLEYNDRLLKNIIAEILKKLPFVLYWLLSADNGHSSDSISHHSNFANSDNYNIDHAGSNCCEYARFVPGFMAPVSASWGKNNRTTAIRIPDKLPQRIEFRVPSSISPPHKIIAFLLHAVFCALQNMERGITPYLPKCIYGNAYDPQYMSDTAFHCGILPTSDLQAYELLAVFFKEHQNAK